MPTMTPEEARWHAEEDARTLAEAERIKADNDRLASARNAASRMAEEELERAKAMNKVAKGRPGTSRAGAPKAKETSPGPNEFNVFRKI